jgi:hypothetical protein
VSTLGKAGIPVATNFVNGGHEWYVWRILLRDFLTRVAFLPQPYATWLSDAPQNSDYTRSTSGLPDIEILSSESYFIYGSGGIGRPAA